MKKSRFTDSQIMEALKRADAGFKVPGIGYQQCVVLPLARQIWRNGRLDDVADEGAGRRESATSEDGR